MSNSSQSSSPPPKDEASSEEDQSRSESPTSWKDRLVQHLLNSKRSLASINHVRRADELCTSTRRAVEQSALNVAKSSFLRSGITAQLDLLGDIHRNTLATARSSRNEFEAAIRDLDRSNERLKQTLQGLRSTMVEAKLRPAGEEKRSLLSFIDEKSVNEALSATKDVIKAASGQISGFEKGCKSFDGELSSIRDFIAADVKGTQEEAKRRYPLPEILHTMEDHAREMAVNLESLVSHLDLCVTAIKHEEGGGDAASEIALDIPDGVDIDGEDAQPLSVEEKKHMRKVIQEDAGQVDDVVVEIRQRNTAMETLMEQVDDHVAFQEKQYTDSLQAYRKLEDIGQTLPGYLTRSQVFLGRWEVEKSKIQEKMEELEGLREFYEGFQRAYDNLIIEIGRRKAMEVRMEKLVQDATVRLEKLYEDDLDERDLFRKEQGDFLPVDIWPGLMDVPARFQVLPVDSMADRVPDISKSVIHRAIRRVHGDG